MKNGKVENCVLREIRNWKFPEPTGGGTVIVSYPFNFTPDDIVFHAQQASEKAMKGFLTWHDQAFRKTHDLSEVGRQCSAIDGALEPLLKRAEKLTVFAWAFRYPGDAEQPSVEEAQAVLAVAREVYETLLAHVPGATEGSR